MSSFPRRLERQYQKHRRGSTPQRTIIGETGYVTIHPTKGARRVSYARVWAQRQIEMIRRGIPLSVRMGEPLSGFAKPEGAA